MTEKLFFGKIKKLRGKKKLFKTDRNSRASYLIFAKNVSQKNILIIKLIKVF